MMDGLFRCDYRPHLDKGLLCVSTSVDNLIHRYNCMDRDVTKGAKLIILPWESVESFEKLKRVWGLRKRHYTIDAIEVV